MIILQNDALSKEEGDEHHEVGVVAQGLAKAATMLANKYHWVITNVPYLVRGRQDERLRFFCENHYPISKNDLATVFLDRCLDFCVDGGTSSIVLPQNWLFQSRYKKFREKLLQNNTWQCIAKLGSGAFETISGEVVKGILITISRGINKEEPGGLFGEVKYDNLLSGVDVSELHTVDEKAKGLQNAEIKRVLQIKQLDNPEARISLELLNVESLMKGHAISVQGLATSDDPRFTCQFWEVFEESLNCWVPMRGTVKSTVFFGGCERLLYWEDGQGQYYQHAMSLKKEGRLGGWKSGTEARGREGIVISQMSQIPVSIYCGEFYDHNACAIIANNTKELPAIWSYLSSELFYREVRLIDQSLKPSNNTFLDIPFNLNDWIFVAKDKYPNGLPKPYTDDPTQWIFHGHPCGSVVWNESIKWTDHGPLRNDDTVLQVAMIRLLGYRWPAELDDSMVLADKQREWVTNSENLASLADEDGIVCISSVRGEASASDRLMNLLASAYGDSWSGDILSQLLKSVGYAGKTLEIWLREKFFTQHCQLFQHRPFIWHIWDGLSDGFAALVNYHKLDYKLLETLIYTYLGDWISHQKQDLSRGIDGSQERLDAAESLKKKLELILEGEAPYDIFVRWKPIEKQSIGWNPDLNDGVRLNIRPFLSIPDVGKKDAGVLRDKPNIKWNKDRGKDVESAPWFHLFNGDRMNDHHLSLAEKQAARENLQDG